MSEVQVSIVLPTYNRAHLLPDAIDSVLSQTFQDWELIIWDDGSEDNTKETVQSYNDNRISYYFGMNKGMSYALNQGIKHSSGELIAFIDDDDQWMPNKLELQVNLFRRNQDTDLAFSNYRNINQMKGTDTIGFLQNSQGLNQLKTKQVSDQIYIIDDCWLQAVSRENFIAFDTVMIHRRLVNKIGLFNEELKNGMDFEYWWRFGLEGCQAAYIDEVLLIRVKYSGGLSSRSITSVDNQINMLDSCKALSKIHNQPEMVQYLRPMYRNAYQNMIIIYGKLGELEKAWRAFKKSLSFGFRFGSIKLLLLSVYDQVVH